MRTSTFLKSENSSWKDLKTEFQKSEELRIFLIHKAKSIESRKLLSIRSYLKTKILSWKINFRKNTTFCWKNVWDEAKMVTWGRGKSWEGRVLKDVLAAEIWADLFMITSYPCKIKPGLTLEPADFLIQNIPIMSRKMSWWTPFTISWISSDVIGPKELIYVTKKPKLVSY